MSVGVGDPFPVVPVESTDGQVDLSERWAQGPLVIAFHRLWCPFCQESMKQLQDARDDLRAAGGDAVVVYQDDIGTVHGKCDERGVPFDCLSDPDRELERAARLERFRPMRYVAFSPRRVVQALRSGARVSMANTDVLKGRGTYVVGRDGRITYAHISATAADIPPVDEIVDAVRASN